MEKPADYKQPEQLNLFEINPEIKNLGIQNIQLSGGKLTGSFVAATEANDIALLTPERWADALAEYLIKCCKGEEADAMRAVTEAFDRLKMAQEIAVGLQIAMQGATVTEIKPRKKKEA